MASGRTLGPDAAPRRPRFAASAILTYTTSVSVAFISLLNVLITARYLGPSGRGQIALVMSIAGATSIVALLGVDQANVTSPGPIRRRVALWRRTRCCWRACSERGQRSSSAC